MVAIYGNQLICEFLVGSHQCKPWSLAQIIKMKQRTIESKGLLFSQQLSVVTRIEIIKEAAKIVLGLTPLGDNKSFNL
jgi:hypothetical protein